MEVNASVSTQTTTVRITKKTLGLLKRIGHKGETYDDIIRRLFEAAFYEDLDRTRDEEEYIPLEAL